MAHLHHPWTTIESHLQEQNISSGVPQGAVTSPNLFQKISINDTRLLVSKLEFSTREYVPTSFINKYCPPRLGEKKGNKKEVKFINLANTPCCAFRMKLFIIIDYEIKKSQIYHSIQNDST